MSNAQGQATDWSGVDRGRNLFSSNSEEEQKPRTPYQPKGNTPIGYLSAGISQDDILLGDGYLERGCASLLAGPSGIGKSSIQMQKGCSWSCGQAAFDLKPPRPLRIVMVQNEDSANDLARQCEVINSLKLDRELIKKISGSRQSVAKSALPPSESWPT